MKLFGLGALPAGGPVIAQPSRPVSNEVLEPSGSVMSSMKTPRPWVAQSLAYEIEISTGPPAYAPRSTCQCSQLPDEPDAAFQLPLVPVGEHDASGLSVW